MNKQSTILIKSSEIILTISIFALTIKSSILDIILPIDFSILYYSLIFLSFLSILLISKSTKIDYKYLPLISSIILSLILNDIPDFFRAPTRAVLWLMMIITFSDILNNKSVYDLRMKVSQRLMTILKLFVILSFVGWIIGFNLNGLTYIKNPYYNGLFQHSMMLGPISAIIGIYEFYKIINLKKITEIKTFSLLTIISSISMLLIASSRIAIVGFLISFLFLIYKKMKIKTFITTLVIFSLFFGIVSYFTEIDKLTEGLNRKGNNFSREYLWEQRVKEIKSSPVWGIGFASIGPEAIRIGDKFDKETGVIETGSAYLSIFSMTGMLGFLSFIILLIKKIKQNTNDPYFYILVFFSIHFLAEGYILSTGSLLSLTFWLTLGLNKKS